MKITWGLENATKNERTIATLGSYDGIHLGHQKILRRLVDKKSELGLDRSIVITFHPHPQLVLKRNDTVVPLLTTIEERLDLLDQQGVDEVLIIKFSLEFSQTSYLDFFHEIILETLGTKAMVVGFNHAFGKNREGDLAHLKRAAPELGISLEEVAPLSVDGLEVSSTKIRNALLAHELGQANLMLGRPYRFTGTVVGGDKIGRTLGYPTANIALPEHKLIPSDGVYATRVLIDGTYYDGALSIGTRPSIVVDGGRVVEVFLLKRTGDLYGKQLSIDCIEYIRPQATFGSLDELRAAIGNDVTLINKILAAHRP